MGISVEIAVDVLEANGLVVLGSTDDEAIVEIRMSGGNNAVSQEVKIEDLRLALRKLTAK
jgi:hypothetical protein